VIRPNPLIFSKNVCFAALMPSSREAESFAFSRRAFRFTSAWRGEVDARSASGGDNELTAYTTL
jgi:hypothetical protein